jgi:hypothetical protein
MAEAAVGQDHVVAQDAFFDRAEAFNGLLRTFKRANTRLFE